MSDKPTRKRHRSDRSPSPDERSSSKDPENRAHRHGDRHKRRRENNNVDPGVNEDTMNKILEGVNDMKKQFVAWTTRVTAIESRLHESSGTTSQFSGEFDDDQLSIHPPGSPKEFDNLVVNNPAIEAPLVGSLPPLDGVEPTNINEITNPSVVVSEEGTSCEFFDPEGSSQRRWSPSDPFGKFLEKNMRRRLTLEQVNEIIGENSPPESDECVAPLLEKIR